jgi:hypothetical protein
MSDWPSNMSKHDTSVVANSESKAVEEISTAYVLVGVAAIIVAVGYATTKLSSVAKERGY